MNRLLENTLIELSSVADDDAMRRIVSEYLTVNGFAGFMFTVHDEADMFTMCTAGQDLLKRYRTNEFYLIDPISRTARASWLPVPWDARDYLSHCTRPQQLLFETTLAHGCERGISAPIRCPSGGVDMFVSLSRHTEREFAQGKDVWKNEMMLIGAYMSSAYHNVLHRCAPQSAELTRRELECLHWTAQGKTAWEVSRLLDVSERTVQFHIRNACGKLDAVSKHQAALKAVHLGLIQP